MFVEGMLFEMKLQVHMLFRPLLLGILLGFPLFALAQARQFQFEQFPVKVYQGPIKIPDGLHKDEDGQWRNDDGKPAAASEVGFAGEYYLPAHSCGTGCRYFDLVSLRTGVSVPAISMFNAGEPLPVTKDGRPYLTMLYYRPDSCMLIAEYHLDFDDPNKTETCRQRYFVLEGDKLRPISRTFPFCTEGHKRRQ
jgi:hypothetical protein